MNVKAVMKNLKKKGFRETLRIRRKNVELRRLLEEYRRAFQKRPFVDMSAPQYREYMDSIFSAQQILDEQMHKEYRKLLKEIKATYIKERIPLEYRKYAVSPVQPKVIFMENGGSKEKTDNDTATTNHGDDRNHSTGDAQRIEIHEIGNRQEYANEDD